MATEEEKTLFAYFEQELRETRTVKPFYVPTQELLEVARKVFGNLRKTVISERVDSDSQLKTTIWLTEDPHTIFVERRTESGEVISRVIEKRSPQCMKDFLRLPIK